MHRKVWEWCFISQALNNHGVLMPGKSGLGFAVGQEPLTAMFASLGARVTATDLYADQAAAGGWIETSQHAGGYEAINKRNICNDAQLRKRVEFRFADMNRIDESFAGRYDFIWSSCAFEHLGSLQHGTDFVINAMRCLRPGGIAVHTTEFNISSNSATVSEGPTVLYRRRDIQELSSRLKMLGYAMYDVDWDIGATSVDAFVDLPPYTHQTHLKLKIGGYTVSSIGLIIVAQH